MTSTMELLRSEIETRQQQSDAEALNAYHRLITLSANDEPLDPQDVLSAMDRVGRTIDDFERDVAVYRQNVEHAATVAAEGDLRQQLHKARAEEQQLAAKLETTIAAIKEERQMVANSIWLIESKLRQVEKAKTALVKSAPDELLAELTRLDGCRRQAITHRAALAKQLSTNESMGLGPDNFAVRETNLRQQLAKLEDSGRAEPADIERIEQALRNLAKERDEAQAELSRVDAQLESIAPQKRAALAACFNTQS